MAIYDNNGTTNSEIGKLYDNNGTTSSQIGKVYDNNGSVDSLVYSAETVLFDNGDVSSITGGWTLARSGSGSGLYNASGSLSNVIRLISGHNEGYYAQTKNKIDFSKYTKLNVTYETTVTGGTSRWFRVKVGDNTDGWNTTDQIYVTSNAESKTISIDISSITNQRKLCFVAHSYLENNPKIDASITKITLE